MTLDRENEMSDRNETTDDRVLQEKILDEGEDEVITLDKDRLASDATEPFQEPSAQNPPFVPVQRVLSKRHFAVALSEIRPSSTEDGTLPELRKVRAGPAISRTLADLTCSGPSNLEKEAVEKAKRVDLAKDSGSGIHPSHRGIQATEK